MKRSKSVKLLVMGAGALALTACDEPQDVGVFESIEQCVSLGGFEQTLCEDNFKTAASEHINVAPKYTSATDCEADFGVAQCETAPQKTTSGGSVFMPMMMGYMMGSMLGGNSRVATQPLYRSADDKANFRTGDNSKVAGKPGISKVPASVAKAPTRKTSTVRRGGFGKTAARTSARSFGG